MQLVLSMVCNVYTRSVVQYQEQTIGRVLANSAPYNFHDQKNDVHFMLTFRIPRKNKTILYIHSDCFYVCDHAALYADIGSQIFSVNQLSYTMKLHVDTLLS